MQEDRALRFGPYRLDTVNERVWRGRRAIQLTGKAFAVLRYLVEHAGQLVSKEELFRSVWPEVIVSDAALAVCIREVRKALGDEAKTPRFIATVHRRGYRFLPPVTTTQLVVSSQYPIVSREGQSSVSSQDSAIRNPQSAMSLVGREAELEQLHRWLEKALGGERQVVFVTGEPGIGKTALVDAFLAQVVTLGHVQSSRSKVQSLQSVIRNPQSAIALVARGQCIEHFGVGEAYLPVLEALGQLGRESGRERLIELLGRHAPTWLAQMPSLLGAADLDALQRKMQGTTRERMLREMAEAVEALTAERPLLLALEDLHWSDYSTLDLLSSLARRRQTARLLLLGTYRPVDVIVSEHPLKAVKQELQLHGHCEELPLRLLTEAAVGEYLAVRFSESRLPPALVQAVYQRTDGNPLFMVNVAEYLISQGVIDEGEEQRGSRGGIEAVTVGVPGSLRQMVEQQFEALDPKTQQVLEAASVAGAEFSIAAVAAGVEEEAEIVEGRCEDLARREQFLQARGMAEWPDGTVTARYGFSHVLYQEVLYERMPVGRRARLHLRIGEREEAAYGERASERGGELAVHFERGRDYRRAVRYLAQAAGNASRSSAHLEAITHLTKGLTLLQTLPDTAEHTQQELTLQIALGAALMATKGYAAPEVATAYARSRELYRQVGETPQLCPVLFGLCAFYLVRAEYTTARELGEQLLRLAQRTRSPDLLLEAHLALGQPLLWCGDFSAAQAHMQQGIALYDPQQHSAHAFLYGQDPGVDCRHWEAIALWALGYPDQALKRNHEALALAQELSHPFSLAAALSLLAGTHRLRREASAAQERAEAAVALSHEQGFALFAALGAIFQGWALAEQGQREEGIAQMRQGLAAWQATGAELGRPYYLALLAEAYGKSGQRDEGLALLTEALTVINKTEERWWEAELYRLKGELLLQSSAQSLASQKKRNDHDVEI